MKEKIILKSVHPEEYPDLEVECRVIPNAEIGAYLESIIAEGADSFYAYKAARVIAQPGVAGQKVHTTLITEVEGKQYVLSEEENVVKERTFVKEGKEVTCPDVVVTNCFSTSNEQYIVKAEKFGKTYTYGEILVDAKGQPFITYSPVYDSRVLTQVPENVIIMTAWGAPAVCLAGSYIVTYDAAGNDYNTIEKGAFDSTYVYEGPAKSRKKN